MKKRLISVLLAVLLLAPAFTVVNAETGFEITRQPADIAAPLGATGFARVEARAEGEIAYRWFYRNPDSDEWIDTGKTDEDGKLELELEGYDTDTIYVPVTETSVGRQFVCMLVDELGNSLQSDTVTVGEGEASQIEIKKQPEDVRAPSGELATAAVEAEIKLPETPPAQEPQAEDEDAPAEEEEVKAALSYKWLYKAADTDDWQDADHEGWNTAAVQIPVTDETAGRIYKCLIRTSDGGSIETDEITVLVPEPAPEPEAEEEPETVPGPSEITIVAQPANIIAKIGQTGTATVEAVSDAPLRYQWFYKTRGTAEWKPSGFAGCNTDTVRVPVTAARIGQQYKCVITTEDGGMAETDAVTVLEQEPSEITIVTQPADIVARIGQTGTATVEASSDAALSYQWYFKSVGKDYWQASGFEGCRTETIRVPVTKARIGQQYKCVITTADGGVVETNAVTVLEPEPSEITIVTQPSDIRARLGENGTATVEAVSGAALSYQWYFKAKGSDVWKVSGFEGNKTNTISVPVATSRIGQQYKCVITTADGGKAETDAVTVLAPQASVITIDSQPEDMYAAVGENASATVSASADSSAALVYQWYFKKAGSDVWQVSGMAGSRTATITVPVTAARIGQQYKCVITTADGGRAETEAVSICESPACEISVTRNPDSYRAYAGDPVELDVSASADAGLQYQWYKDGAAIAGATDSRLYFTAIAPENAGEYYCVVTARGNKVASKTAVVIVFE